MRVTLLFIFAFLIANNAKAQVRDTIYGRIISSVTKAAPHSEAIIMEKGTSNGTMTDSLGIFKLVPTKNNPEYLLEIVVGSYEPMEYTYKSEWSQRNNPKSIVISANCDFSDNDFKDTMPKGLKLFIVGGIAPIANSRSDEIFERRFNLKYYDFGCEPVVYECIVENNNRVFMILDRLHGDKWRKRVRSDVIGLTN